MNLDRIDWPADPPPRRSRCLVTACLLAGFALGFLVMRTVR